MAKPKRVVFICAENTHRSQMAQAFARIHGAGQIESYSAGLRPSGQINPMAVEAMKLVGCDLTLHRSKGLGELPNVEFDLAITLGCGDECPSIRTKGREDWNIPDPVELPDGFREVSKLIEEMVKDLSRRLFTGDAGGLASS